jgi:hemolysin activation/secretion protein
MRDANLLGVFVTPDAAQFALVDGRVVDRRAPGDTSLTLLVTIARVSEVRTVALGERVPEDQTINHPLHARLLSRSPIVGENAEGAADSSPETDGKVRLLRTDLIDDFVYRLNRHPGRRVDPSVSAPGEAPGQTRLDYIVTENRPWLFFGQVSNTGSGSTSAWREHLGFIHNDLTNHDDIFQVGYHTANFQDVHLLYTNYTRPITERLKWRVEGSWYTYLASDVGQPDADFEGDGYDFGGELIYNFYQERELFLDLFAGAKFQHVGVDNQLAQVEGDSDFFLPRVGVRLERHREDTRTDAMLGLRFNMPGVAGTDDDLDPLGRTDPDRSFAVLQGEVTHSFYLDPILRTSAGQGSQGAGLAHEILLAGRGQSSLGSRLIPNEQMTAGGLYTVRGYPESIVAGDSVYMGTLEYRLHVPRALSPELNPGSFIGEPFRWRPQYEYGPTDWDLVLKAFVDAASVSQSSRESFEFDSTLIGAGIGAELAITRRFNLRADLGFALNEVRDASGESVVDAGHVELHLVLTVIY